MPTPWPPGFARIPDDDWVHAPVDALALKYDTVENHGWYDNLDPTVTDLAAFLRDGSVLVDYSGGTGILMGRLFGEVGERRVGVVNVDSSPKFLRLSLEKFRDEERVAFRRLRYLKAERRLELVHEVLGAPLVDRGVDALASTNAIHLYYDLDDTVASWHRVLRDGARVFVNSGNVAHDSERWIIDDTVHAVHEAAREVVREDADFAAYRAAADDADVMRAHDEYRRKVFLPPRPLDYYVDAFDRAGLRVVDVRHRPVRANVDEWLDFLAVYHDAILGWVGGSQKVEGNAPGERAVTDRGRLMRLAVERVFGGKDDFEAEWTYVTCER